MWKSVSQMLHSVLSVHLPMTKIITEYWLQDQFHVSKILTIWLLNTIGGGGDIYLYDLPSDLLNYIFHECTILPVVFWKWKTTNSHSQNNLFSGTCQENFQKRNNSEIIDNFQRMPKSRVVCLECVIVLSYRLDSWLL